MPRDIRLLPKANLHLHFAGAMRPGTVLELAKLHGVVLEPDLGFGNSDWSRGRHEWESFQRRYDAATSTIQTEDDIRRVILEAAADNTADGATWLELSINPTRCGRLLGSLPKAMEVLIDACRQAEAATGIGMGLVITTNWKVMSRDAELLAKIAAQYAGRGVVGFGIAGDDRVGDVGTFREAFSIARQAGLIATPHSGFYAPPSHTLRCADLLNAGRIGHGITSGWNGEALEVLSRKGIALEVCPTSYPPLGVAKSLAEVPLRAIYDSGVQVALGTDDPLLFGAGLNDQYETARTLHNFSDEELADLARQSFHVSAASEELKESANEHIGQWLHVKNYLRFP
jgi:adenosine deaminase